MHHDKVAAMIKMVVIMMLRNVKDYDIDVKDGDEDDESMMVAL